MFFFGEGDRANTLFGPFGQWGKISFIFAVRLSSLLVNIYYNKSMICDIDVFTHLTVWANIIDFTSLMFRANKIDFTYLMVWANNTIDFTSLMVWANKIDFNLTTSQASTIVFLNFCDMQFYPDQHSFFQEQIGVLKIIKTVYLPYFCQFGKQPSVMRNS